MSGTTFVVGSRVHGVPVVYDPVSFIEATGRWREYPYADLQDLAEHVEHTLACREIDEANGNAWPACGCGRVCGACRPLRIVCDQDGHRAVLVPVDG